MNDIERAYCGIDAWDAAGRGQGVQKIAMWELESSRINPDLFAGFNVVIPPEKIDRACKSDHLMDTTGTVLAIRPNDEIHVLAGTSVERWRYCIDNRIDIINISLDAAMDNPIDNALQADFMSQGGIVVVAAGNEGADGLSGLARKPTTISVGAVRYAGGSIVREHFSSNDERGDALDCMGFDCVQGIHSTDRPAGTSFAAPWVTSIIAYFRADFIEQKGRRPTYPETLAFIRGYSIDIEAPGYDVYTGNGILRLPEIVQQPPEPEYDFLELTAGQKLAKLNGEPYTLLTMPELKNGSLTVGMRDSVQAFGGKVHSWNNNTKTAVLKMPRKKGV